MDLVDPYISLILVVYDPACSSLIKLDALVNHGPVPRILTSLHLSTQVSFLNLDITHREQDVCLKVSTYTMAITFVSVPSFQKHTSHIYIDSAQQILFLEPLHQGSRPRNDNPHHLFPTRKLHGEDSVTILYNPLLPIDTISQKDYP